MFDGRVILAILFSATCINTGVLAAITPPHLDSSGANLQPNYPAAALPNREQGAIVVNAEITENGNVRRVLLLQSTGFDDLDRAGIEAVLGWRFVPAVETGRPVVGWVKEKVLFVPPGTKENSGGEGGSSAQVSVYLAPVLSLIGPYGEFARVTKAVPCSRGTIAATVKMLRAAGPYFDPARVGIEVASGSERVEISTSPGTAVYPPIEGFGTRLENSGRRVSGEEFDGMALQGSETALSLAWDENGSITANSHRFGTHLIQMSAPPISFGLFANSASARFSNAALTCWGKGETPE